MIDYQFLPQFPLTANPLALFGALLLAGVLAGEFVKRILRLPRITGYVLIGLLLGDSGFNILDVRMLEYARVFIDIGLGLVLFELGRRLDFNWLKRDRWLLVMALAESLLSFVCMLGALLWFDIAPLYAAVAAAIGVSSSPAIVLLVAREERAEGQVTERALNLVAFNSVMAFVFVTMLMSWIHHEYHVSWMTAVLHPLYILVGSVLLGWLASVVTLACARWLGKQGELHTVLLLAFIVALIGTAAALKISVLIALLAFGVLIKNLDDKHVLMAVDLSRFGQIFFIVLFVTSGAVLHTHELIAGGSIALIYIAARFVGKSIGVLSLAHLSGIRAGSGGLLSIALMPMSGIAIAMTLGAESLYPAFGVQLASVVLAAALILELVGPLAVQFALRRAGETHKAET